jgi:S-formylglutathione hydrolase FrmB
VAVYFLTALLVLAHESERLSLWLEDFGRAGTSSYRISALNLAADLKSLARRSGIVSLGEHESHFLAALTPTLTVGTRSAPEVSTPVQAEASVVVEVGRFDLFSFPDSQPDFSAPLAELLTIDQPSNPYAAAAAMSPAPSADLLVSLSQISSPNPVSSLALVSTAGGPQTPLAALLSASPANPQPDVYPLVIPPAYTNPLRATLRAFNKVLLTGDSMMMEGIGPRLESHLKNTAAYEVVRQAQYSTGLCRPDVLNWTDYLQSLLETNDPDLMIISLGANDTQDIIDETGKRHKVTTESWNEQYEKRVLALLTIAAEHQVAVIWLGLPFMGVEPYNARAQNINSVLKKTCQSQADCLFWDSTGSLVNSDGRYSTYLPNSKGKHIRVRKKDSIHLTEAGGDMMLADFLEQTSKLVFWGLEGQQAPAPDQPPITFAAQMAPAPPTAPVLAGLNVTEAGLTHESSIRRVELSSVMAPSSGAPDVPVSSSFPEPQPALAAPLNEVQIFETSLSDQPPPTEPNPDKWVLTETVLLSPNRGTTRYQAVTPPTNVKTELWPAVFLLHGAEGDQRYFSKNLGPLLTQTAQRLGLILIMPDGDKFGWYADSPVNSKSHIASYIIEELIPEVLSRYPIDPNRLAVSGISMGGHGALTLAINYPGRFKAASSISGVIDLASHNSEGTLDQYLRLEEVFGHPGVAAVNWRRYSAYDLTRLSPQRLAEIPLKLSVGLGDRLCLAENRQYDRLLTELALEHEYSERSGGHGWQLFSAEFPLHMEFLAARLKAEEPKND